MKNTISQNKDLTSDPSWIATRLYLGLQKTTLFFQTNPIKLIDRQQKSRRKTMAALQLSGERRET
jgi:hypothetical protein